MREFIEIAKKLPRERRDELFARIHEKTAVSWHTIFAWCYGKRNPRPAYRAAITEALNELDINIEDPNFL